MPNPPYATLCENLAIPLRDDTVDVTIRGVDPVAPSVHRIGDATAAALATLGREAATVARERGLGTVAVAVSAEAAVLQLMAAFMTTVNGVPAARTMEDPRLLNDCDFYRTRDGRHIYVMLAYPHLRDIACQVLGCPPGKEAIAAAAAEWNAFDLEEAIMQHGGTAAVARTREEWRSHEQGVLLGGRPVIGIEAVGHSEPEPIGRAGQEHRVTGLPLEHVRVLDNTHVIAGPIAARQFAELGADVLHMSTPDHPDPNALVIETGLGKRNAFCDLNDSDDKAAFWQALADADVYVNSYLGMEAKGVDVASLAAARPGLIMLEYTCWGSQGPWADRGGFDQMACAATGLAVEQGGPDTPALPPTYLLNDYLAAVLGTAGVLEALRRRAANGGTYLVRVDLARVCMWVQDLGLLPASALAGLTVPQAGSAVVSPRTVNGAFGTTAYLPTQIAYTGTEPRLSAGAAPLGSSPLTWRAR
ncbi:CoA transferase [Streptomyces sp. NPDC054808]